MWVYFVLSHHVISSAAVITEMGQRCSSPASLLDQIYLYCYLPILMQLSKLRSWTVGLPWKRDFSLTMHVWIQLSWVEFPHLPFWKDQWNRSRIQVNTGQITLRFGVDPHHQLNPQVNFLPAINQGLSKQKISFCNLYTCRLCSVWQAIRPRNFHHPQTMNQLHGLLA